MSQTDYTDDLTDIPAVDDPVTNPFDDLNAHQRLMMQLQKAVDEAMQTTQAARDALEELVNHNTDSAAHPDLRREVDGLGQNSLDQVDERIQQHDESPTAHAVMRAQLEAAMADISKVRVLMDEVISEHDASEASHPEFREFMAEVKVQLGIHNINTVVENLDKLQSYIDNEMNDAITALQNADARHDKLIHDNALEITNAYEKVDSLNDDLVSLTGSIAKHSEIDKLRVDTAAASIESTQGLVTYNADGPNLSGMTSTFPPYVQKGESFNFKINGASPKTAGGSVTYDIEAVGNAFSFSPSTNIAQNTDITCTCGAALKPGDVVTFKVKAKDSGTNKVTEKIIGAVVASPMDVTTLALTGLPENVEPGITYNAVIRNLVDDGTGRWTYSFNSKTSAINFAPNQNLKAGDSVMIEIPASARRNTDLTFAIVVHDKYNEDIDKDIKVHVNSVAGAEDFNASAIPTAVIPGGAYDIRMSGILSADGTPATYEVISDSEYVTFSKDSAILANENVRMTIAQDAPRGTSQRFVVKATDNNDNVINIEQFVTINRLPEANTVTTNLPTSSKGGVVLQMQLTGGSDLDNPDEALTYTINPNNSGLSFSKISGIKPNEKVVVTLPKVSTDTEKVFQILVVDSMGEASALAKNISIQVEPIYIANTPYIIHPQDGNTVDAAFTMTWSEFSSYTDMSANAVAEALSLFMDR